MVKIRHFLLLFWNAQRSLCYGAKKHPQSLLHRQNTMSNTWNGPWRYWFYYACFFWDLHKQIRRFPQIFRKLKSLCGKIKNMRTSRTRWTYCTNSIHHKERKICAENQNRMDLVDILHELDVGTFDAKKSNKNLFPCRIGNFWKYIGCCQCHAHM